MGLQKNSIGRSRSASEPVPYLTPIDEVLLEDDESEELSVPSMDDVVEAPSKAKVDEAIEPQSVSTPGKQSEFVQIPDTPVLRKAVPAVIKPAPVVKTPDPTKAWPASSYITPSSPPPLRAPPPIRNLNPAAVSYPSPTYINTMPIRGLGPHVIIQGMPDIKQTRTQLRRAQAVLPAVCCVFVGNLPANWSDGMLTHAVDFEFAKHGPCVVAVFRKTEKKPYAIVQYGSESAALAAVLDGQGLWMERKLRVEWSQRATF